MCDRLRCDGPDVLRRQLRTPREGRRRAGRLGHDDLAAVPRDLELRGDPGAQRQGVIAEPHIGDRLACGLQRVPALAVESGAPVQPRGGRPDALLLEAQDRPQDLATHQRVEFRAHRDQQAEPVEELGAQRAFLGVHGADQGEGQRDLRLVQALALYGQQAGGDHVEDEVDDVVVQQVDLVDVEHALSTRLFEQSGLGLGLPGHQGVDPPAPDDPVVGHVHRQRHRQLAVHHAGERPYDRRLGCATLPADQHPAHGRHHVRDLESTSQSVLPDHVAVRQQRKCRGLRHSSGRSSAWRSATGPRWSTRRSRRRPWRPASPRIAAPARRAVCPRASRRASA